MAAAAKTSTKKTASKTSKTSTVAKAMAKKVVAASKRGTARAVVSKTKTAVAAATKSAPSKVASSKKATLAKVTDPRRTAFVRLAEGRTSQAIKQIRLLGNLSNLSAYNFSAADINQILDSLQEEIGATRARFETSLASAALKRERSFKLGGFDARA